MEFSQYVLDVITSINDVVKDHDISSVSFIREASENAPSEEEAHILNVIAGAATMYYNANEHSFGPFIRLNDGNRSFAPEDINEIDLNILCTII